MVLLASCYANPGAIFGEEVSKAIDAYKNSIFLRIANRGQWQQQVQLRVDGRLVTLPRCDANGATPCDSILSTCPETIELVQETRFDANGGFAGGRSFNGNEAYIFHRGEFECGATILFEFTDTSATTTILN